MGIRPSRSLTHSFLQSINLTQLPKTQKSPSGKEIVNDENAIEYSSREVKPPDLLLSDLLRAHSTFLLHHASSISALFVRNRRSKFINILGRYWDEFLSTWNVMLHGNPAVAVYGGIKLAASGELGIGVGEEDRGSGEREVLEGFVGRVDGLVDLVVSRFGDAPQIENGKGKQAQLHGGQRQRWLGTGTEPGAEDGAVFLGVGALSRKSLRDITHWMEDVYSWGPKAYGVMDNPTSTRQQHRKTKKRPTKSSQGSEQTQTSTSTFAPAEIERPPLPDPASNDTITSAISQSTINASKASKASSRRTSKEFKKKNGAESSVKEVPPTQMELPGSEATPTQETINEQRQKRPTYRRARSSNSSTRSTKGAKFTDYFKLGYGTHWTLTGNSSKKDHKDQPLSPVAATPPPQDEQIQIPKPLVQHPDSNDSPDGFDKPYYPSDDSVGHYLVGLLGDVEAEPNSNGSADESGEGSGTRVVVRTVTVELEREGDARDEKDISIDLSTAEADVVSSKAGSSQHTGTSHASSFEGQDRNKTKKLRIVVYCRKPFIYTLLFELRTESLAFPTLYKSLHHQLSPLSRPLLNSTSQPLERPNVNKTPSDAKTPIYDLIWDPKTLIITTSLPNIPGPSHALDNQPPWSRLEALNTHTQLLNTFIDTRSEITELERSCKTSRAYWIVWTRVPDPVTPESLKPETQERLRSIEPISELESAEPSRSTRPELMKTLSGRSASMKLTGKGMSEFNHRTPDRNGSGYFGSSGVGLGANDSGRKGSGRSGSKSKGKSKQKSTRWSDTSRSWNNSSLNSGPAHPFFDTPNPVKEHLKVDKEVWLIRKAGEETSRGGQVSTLGRGIGVDVPAYVQGLLAMVK